MRQILLLQLLLVLALNSVLAQNQIDSLTVFPYNPTVNDSIEIIAHYTFTSSSCPLDIKSFTRSGTTINASSQHCLGLLSMVCNSSDTFKLGRLQARNYSFRLSLSTGALSGMGTACTPGIVPDDSSSVNFNVRPLLTSLLNLEGKAIRCYPNPVKDKLYFQQLPAKYSLRVFNQLGQLILKTEAASAKNLDVSKLEQGFYFIEITSTKIRHQLNFIKIP